MEIRMHKFLRAVGFSEIKKEDLNKIFEKVMEYPYFEKSAQDSEGNEFIEIMKEFGDFFGIAVRGTYDEDDEFQMDYYYPYYCGSTISTLEIPEVEKYAEKESYAGVCDEVRVGMTLIFYLQNVADYLTETYEPIYNMEKFGVILSGLSTEGKILFPINKDEEQRKKAQQQKVERAELITAARNGDETAIENLTLEDMATYSMISRRIVNEDILSIVENYFMPYGVESDQYSILGDIKDWKVLQNDYTGENVYLIDIFCNDIPISVCINQKDLLGEPAVGRRFKGTIWLQGNIYYQT